MPNFFSSLFGTKQKPPSSVRFVAGEQVTRSKTTAEVLGDSFNYKSGFNAQSTFCKKLLKYCSSQYQSAELVFLLVHDKYKKTPTAALLTTIYNDFIVLSSDYQINISAVKANKIKDAVELIAVNPEIPPSPTLFDSIVSEMQALISDNQIKSLKTAKFDTAFHFDHPTKEAHFNAAILYLRTHHQINLV